MTKKKLFFIICSSLLVCAGALYIFFGSFFHLSFIKIHSDTHLASQKIFFKKKSNIQTHINKYKGQNIWTISLKKMIKKLSAKYPNFIFRAVRKFPNTLLLFFKKKRTAYLLFYNNNLFLLSQQGDINGKASVGDFIDFPVLRGSVFFKKPDIKKQAVSILASLPKDNSILSIKNISEVLYHKKNSSFLLYLINKNYIIELAARLHSKKIKNIIFVLNYLNQKKQDKTWIDARLGKKIIVKKLHLKKAKFK